MLAILRAPRRARAAGLLVALAGACAALAVVDPARAGIPLCPLRAATGILCPLCGSTRAAHHLLTGDPSGAFALNPLTAVLLPLAVAALTVLAVRALRGREVRAPRLRPAWVVAGVTLAVAFGVLRNLVQMPGAI